MSGPFELPDFVERKGTLFLRSDHMNYSRATLNSNWHQARESEPKDYDISTAPERNLCTSTYNRIGDVTDGNIPETTYEDHTKQIYRCKKDFQEQESHQPMVTSETVQDAVIDRDTGTPQKGFGAVLPGHHPEHDKRHLETTHRADYTSPFPYASTDQNSGAPAPAAEDQADLSAAYKRCLSQFADTTNHRRAGWNTWQDESGVYSNTHYKRQVFQPTRTITAAYE